LPTARQVMPVPRICVVAEVRFDRVVVQTDAVECALMASSFESEAAPYRLDGAEH
jgi:hypothetical protein